MSEVVACRVDCFVKQAVDFGRGLFLVEVDC